MKKLTIPRALSVEFHSIRVLWKSLAETRRVDSLVLAWVKFEKQLRRLFCFLVFQHPAIDESEINAIIDAMAANNRLYPETFLRAIDALGVTPIPLLLKSRYAELWPHVERIKDYRNKLVHGQITGKSIQSPQLEHDVQLLITWVSEVASACQTSWGYDGVGRKTYRAAKSVKTIVVKTFPFQNATEFRAWLLDISKPKKG